MPRASCRTTRRIAQRWLEAIKLANCRQRRCRTRKHGRAIRSVSLYHHARFRFETKSMSTGPSTFRQAVRLVALLNLGYFAIGFVVALPIGSVSLLADSVDFLEAASVNFLILMALGWSPRARARLGMALAAILLVPALAALWTAWQKLALPVPPAPL